jgi:choline dehydrogenase-like flavoprotein
MTQYDNLYVCDCSVIPEAWGVPPTTTIVALGKRLAKYLLGKRKQIQQKLLFFKPEKELKERVDI